MRFILQTARWWLVIRWIRAGTNDPAPISRPSSTAEPATTPVIRSSSLAGRLMTTRLTAQAVANIAGNPIAVPARKSASLLCSARLASMPNAPTMIASAASPQPVVQKLNQRHWAGVLRPLGRSVIRSRAQRVRYVPPTSQASRYAPPIGSCQRNT